MGSDARRQIRALLNEWKARGWTDVDNTASRIAEALRAGKSATEAAREASAPFLAKNDAGRSDVDAAVHSALLPRARRTAVVLTALDVEYREVRGQLSDLHATVTSHGTRFEVGRLNGNEIDWNIAVAQIGTGNIGAAVEATQAIVEFDPDLVLFVGVAGAVKPGLEVGTVVIAGHVAYYEGGADTADGWKARPITFKTSHRLTQHASSVARDWPHGPTVLKPIAAGEALVKSSVSEVGGIVDRHYNDAVAVDMESAGMYDAAQRADRPALALRGISDHLQDKSADSDRRDQPLAAKKAAMFAADLLRTADAFVLPSVR